MSISLIPEIPEEERKYFKKFYVMYSKLLALDLNKDQILYCKARFKRITELLEKGLYKNAREEMADCLMKLQLRMPLKTITPK